MVTNAPDSVEKFVSPQKTSHTREKAMKSAVLYILTVVLSFSGLNALAQGTCHSGNAQYPGAATNPPYVGNGGYPSAADVQSFLSGTAATAVNAAAPAATLAPAAPQARITVVDPVEANAARKMSAVPATQAARITVVSDGNLGASSVASTSADTEAPSNTISDNLKGLVGNWTAVARYGDNQLSTVQLQLDDRGWATLTMPGSDGKPKTIKSRVELKNDEIKLTSPEAATVALGKLVSVNERQMVLEKAGGQVTFVRI
jgi:hypothetical protein